MTSVSMNILVNLRPKLLIAPITSFFSSKSFTSLDLLKDYGFSRSWNGCHQHKESDDIVKKKIQGVDQEIWMVKDLKKGRSC